jgi:glyoxylase-like metal-dependent hydrolase (beta-lactamase superfamily II)
MRKVITDVYLLEGLRGSNVFLLTSDKGLTLVDCGLYSDSHLIRTQIQKAGFTMSNLHNIVLTHAHGDHTGSVAELARCSDAQVLAHRDEAPYIEQTKPLPMNSFIQSVLNWLSNRILFRLTPCKVDRLLKNGDIINILDRIQVIHTPGHTPGSLCLYQPERRILFCGDALFNANPITGRPGLRLPIPILSLDNKEARDSVCELSALAVEVLCCGHGEPILDGASDKIKKLIM